MFNREHCDFNILMFECVFVCSEYVKVHAQRKPNNDSSKHILQKKKKQTGMLYLSKVASLPHHGACWMRNMHTRKFDKWKKYKHPFLDSWNDIEKSGVVTPLYIIQQMSSFRHSVQDHGFEDLTQSNSF